MPLVPPFVSNSADNTHCVGAVYRMLFLHYFGRPYTWKDMDVMGKTVPGKGSWNVPYDIAIAKMGVGVRNIELTNYGRLYREREEYLTKEFGRENAAYYINHSNILNIIGDIPEFLHIVPHESRRATLDDIYGALSRGDLVAAEVDSGKLNGSGKLVLHFVLLYGLDGDDILLHDPGLPPAPSRKIPRNEFLDCFAYPGAGSGIDIFTDPKITI